MADKSKELTPELVSRVFSMMGRKGAAARNKSLTAKQRKQQASEAAKARWAVAKRKHPEVTK